MRYARRLPSPLAALHHNLLPPNVPNAPSLCPFLCSSKEISLLAAMHLKPPFLRAQLNWDQLNLATALERQSKLRAKPDP